MADERLRRLERVRAKSAADEVAYLTAALRARAVPRARLELAARLGDEAAATALGIDATPRPALTEEELLPLLRGVEREACVVVPLALARALRPRWDRFTRSDRVGRLVAAAEAWLAEPTEEHRLAARRAAKPLSRGGWQEALDLITGHGKRQRCHWNRQPRDQFPHGPLFAERFATLAARAAGATSTARARDAATEALLAVGGTPMGFDQAGLGGSGHDAAERARDEAADRVAAALAGWALHRTLAQVRATAPLRPPPPPPLPAADPEPLPRWLVEMDEQIAAEQAARKKERRDLVRALRRLDRPPGKKKA